MLKRLQKDEKGNVMVIVAFALSVLMAAAAMAVDAGQLYFEKSKLQKTVDAAALAGAHAYYSGNPEEEAKEVAQLNGFTAEEVGAKEGRVTVSHVSNVALSFARIIGMNDADVYADATAATAALGRGDRIAPIAVEENQIPNGTYLSCAKPGEGGNCGYLTGNGTGASALNDALINGRTIEVGTYRLETEPGNKVGQVRSAVEELIAKDSGNSKCGNKDTADASCYRVITIPVTEPNAFSSASGRTHVEIRGFASYWVERYSNQGGQNRIIGHYIDMVRLGEGDPNARNYGAHIVSLIE
jgi:Flp pilus assembly protein TadG